MRRRMVKLMDRLDKRLKDDAGLIRADISPEMQERIRASISSTYPVDQELQRPETRGVSLWLSSSLTGLAAAALVIVLVNWKTTVEPLEETSPTPSQTILSIPTGFPLSAETAELTIPLEEELRNLQSDLEKARENVERDLKMSF